MVGTVWWLLTNFLYIKNVSSDDNLRTLAGAETVPVGWWWERMGETQGTLGWFAGSRFTSWIVYFAVSVMELGAWCAYETGHLGFAAWYF